MSKLKKATIIGNSSVDNQIVVFLVFTNSYRT